MGPLAHDKSEMLFIIEILFGGLIFFFSCVLNFPEEEICHCFEKMDEAELFFNCLLNFSCSWPQLFWKLLKTTL